MFSGKDAYRFSDIQLYSVEFLTDVSVCREGGRYHLAIISTGKGFHRLQKITPGIYPRLCVSEQLFTGMLPVVLPCYRILQPDKAEFLQIAPGSVSSGATP